MESVVSMAAWVTSIVAGCWCVVSSTGLVLDTSAASVVSSVFVVGIAGSTVICSVITCSDVIPSVTNGLVTFLSVVTSSVWAGSVVSGSLGVMLLESAVVCGDAVVIFECSFVTMASGVDCSVMSIDGVVCADGSVMSTEGLVYTVFVVIASVTSTSKSVVGDSRDVTASNVVVPVLVASDAAAVPAVSVVSISTATVVIVDDVIADDSRVMTVVSPVARSPVMINGDSVSTVAVTDASTMLSEAFTFIMNTTTSERQSEPNQLHVYAHVQ